MANPQDLDQVARIAASKLGAEQAPAAAPQAAPQPQAKPEADPRPTAQEKANEVGSPETEGDKSQMESVIYEVDFNGQKRQLTPQQITSTFDRYAKMNHQHAQMKPVMEIAQQLMSATKGDSAKAADLMKNALMAMSKNTTMGKKAPEQQPNGNPQNTAKPVTQMPTSNDMEAALKQYEDENAITLPPGYREQMAKMSQMERLMGKQMQAMQAMLGQAKASGQQGLDAAKAAQMDRRNVIQQSIANNLDRAQQKYGLEDGEAQDFMTFAGERGYTLEDFSDANLLDRVAGDYKSVRSSGELERLKQQNARRQSFLRTQESSPMGAASGNSGEGTLERLAMKAMQNR